MAAAAAPVRPIITTFDDLVQRNPQLQQIVEQALKIDLTITKQFKIGKIILNKISTTYYEVNANHCQEAIRQLSEEQLKYHNIEVTFKSNQLVASFAWAHQAPVPALQFKNLCVIL